jgi:hypothetical protein
MTASSPRPLHFSFLCLLISFFTITHVMAQVVINEGSNKNYLSIHDEDMDYPDWIEIYNTGTDTINLDGYALTDDPEQPAQWTFPAVRIAPGEFRIVFCSGKDRKPLTGFEYVLNTGTFKAYPGWNTHTFNAPFRWDGVFNILLNVCSYSSRGYTTNSVFNQTFQPYPSTLMAIQDGSPYICFSPYGFLSTLRPNIRFNDIAIGTDTVRNSPTDYPAPYGNWYWAARHQILYKADELIAAGLEAGDINSLAFDVYATDTNTVYDYIEYSMRLVTKEELNTEFETVDTNNYLHTNFKIASEGETIYLFSPENQLLSSLLIEAKGLDNSNGSFPDGSAEAALFPLATPGMTNNFSTPVSGQLLQPVFSHPSGMYDDMISVSINDPNANPASIHYTTDGSEPTTLSPQYDGTPIPVYFSSVLKARAFTEGILSSNATVSSYLLGVDHATPILSVVTDRSNLYGPEGIFDNWPLDWERTSYVEYFDAEQQLIFSQHAGMQVDGGAGGSRSQPQHSFRIELDDPVLGEGPINYPLIPNRTERIKYSNIYLRNGSNQYLVLPYKDACQVESMCAETNNYYSAWRPVTVYINGQYFGLYELREKIDEEFFTTLDDAKEGTIDLLSQSFWNGGVLRAVEGDVDPFYASSDAFNALDPASPDFWEQADQYFDMTWYTDYIIAESWMPNTDWPWNNIRLYRSDKTNYRWRFCVIDLELALLPNGWADCYHDQIRYMLEQDPNNRYINIWLKSMQNPRFRNYFINRYADIMNTTYDIKRISAIEHDMFGQTVMEMPLEYARWADPNQVGQYMTDFTNRHHEFQFQLSQRTEQVRNHIQNNLGLNAQVAVTLDVFPEGAGKIQISTITPDALPWTGIYFDGNPVVITAIPNPGYEFVYWDANAMLADPDFNPSLDLNINVSDTFRAVFATSGPLPTITLSELNYHSDSTRNAGDWIELWNFGAEQVNLTGWRFTDGTNAYFFPAGTIVAPDARLVLAEDLERFNVEHAGVQAIGPLEFEFSNATETLSLINDGNQVVAGMTYDDAAPWPEVADGFGRTLELKNETADLSAADNWFAGCIGGSPGAEFTPCQEKIIFSEINYKSSDMADAGDWIEIFNHQQVAADISGWIFSDDDDEHLYQIPSGTIVPPSGYVVLYNDEVKFDSRFPDVSNSVGPFDFGLGSAGDALRLYDGSGQLIQSMVYGTQSPWPQGANGNGYTLQIVDPEGLCCEASNWIDGCPEGTPGKPFVWPCDLTSVDEELINAHLQFYPNPSTGFFRLSWTYSGVEFGSAALDVFNTVGEKVHSAGGLALNNGMDLDLTFLPVGVYVARVQVGRSTITKKLVIVDKGR